MTHGETDLSVLLRSMQPIHNPGEYVFCTVAPAQMTAAQMTATQTTDLQPIGTFEEAEGRTLVLRREVADRSQLPYDAVFAWITLSVHSSLSAVGFLAAITQTLSAQGISVNPVSAYYHDHLFVPIDRTAEVMVLLESLSQGT